MSGVTPLVDTLLATRLAQRLDLVPLKGQFDIAGPGVVTQVEQVSNDVRLSSRAALQQQLSAVSAAGVDQGASAPGVPLDQSVTLSAVARALTAILDPPTDPSVKITGTQALWPQPQKPDGRQLAATLLDTVAHSGLFYESHLQQFAAGERTLAQLAREPQAHLGSLAQASEAGPAAALATASGAPASPDPVAAIHPQAVALVRQQLELLALPLFRWSGEAWPGTPLEWEIQEESREPQGGADEPAPQRSWTSKLALELPTLGALEARLNLAGNTLQLRLAARQPATVSLLGQAGSGLPQRLGAVGLQLTGLQIGTLAPVSMPVT
ncbi:MAG: flagellar hook-length control protein FliK [Rhodoferax sp.]|uniref:flagellar hook-length control protein FliK n=1 Tax=Rhodoferax sp. TaxID=50421 RepID=UPI00261DBF7A|nr:flagellar hook-length control protein FliK [Rhodoferax sp.]MDD5335623.1 flagellar hook-length control protein FliK [Rhodoferax sp.]